MEPEEFWRILQWMECVQVDGSSPVRMKDRRRKGVIVELEVHPGRSTHPSGGGREVGC